MKIVKRVCNTLYRLLRGEWNAGWQNWDGKPRFALFCNYYHGWTYTLHIGPVWVECDYPPWGKPQKEGK